MYTLIVVIGVLSQGARSTVMPVGVTSSNLRRFKNLMSARQQRVSPRRRPCFRSRLSTTWDINSSCTYAAETSPVCMSG